MHKLKFTKKITKNNCFGGSDNQTCISTVWR